MSTYTSDARCSRHGFAAAVLALLPFLCLACKSTLAIQNTSQQASAPAEIVAAGPRPAYDFSAADLALLDETEHGCFEFFWKEVGTPARLAKDRMKGPVGSIASVGFQLASLPVGVERGWITREQGELRARTALSALINRTDNRKWGMYLHFLDHNTGGRSDTGFFFEYSTVDTSLMLAGAMVASEYFGGEVRSIVDRMLAEPEWKRWQVGKDRLISMAWQPTDQKNPDGPGRLLDSVWCDAADEERLVYFLAAGSPTDDHALEPAAYYRLNRTVMQHADDSPFVVSYPGIVFTYVFSHCYIDYRSLGADQPAKFGSRKPRVDWFENSRRALTTHRHRCIELGAKYKTLSAERWGLSACASRDGYIVPDVRPNLRDREEVFEGTIAPYAAGSAIMFLPKESVAALRAFRELRGKDGRLLVWRDPKEGGYGFVDSFNLDWNYAHEDYTGIDEGPMLLAIENARSGLIWKLFMRHPVARTRRIISKLPCCTSLHIGRANTACRVP
ncbi:MAG: hypothetical protein HZB38_12800 [Planctomycetes bacterium]|nr:hypothetical protein [Planctomycetota bacterium]